MKKNYTWKILSMVACLLLSLFVVSCQKDKDEITEEQARIVFANADVVMDRVSEIYEASETVEEMEQHLAEIRAMSNVEDAYRDDISICVKIKDGGIIMWCFYPDPEEEEEKNAVDFDELFKNISKSMLSGKGGSLCEEKSICILNVLYDDYELGNVSGYEMIESAFDALKWKHCVRKNKEVTPDFIIDTMPDFGMAIINTHGLFSDSQHWLMTGQLYNDIKYLPEYKELCKSWKDDLRRIMFVSDDGHIAISESLLDILITKKFPRNSILFLDACQTLKGNNSLWLKLKSKGLGCMLGYTESVYWNESKRCLRTFIEKMIDDGTTTSEACASANDEISYLRHRVNGLNFLCYPENSDIILVEKQEPTEKAILHTIRAAYNTEKIVFEYNSNVSSGTHLETSDSDVPIYGNQNGKIYTISTNSSQIYAPENCSGLFQYVGQLREIDFGNGFNTSNVTNMREMFGSCSQLTILDISDWNTSKVTNMRRMFHGCSDLTELNLSGWSTSNVTDMREMFYDCGDLTDLHISGWNTSRVTDMRGMFARCFSLTNLNISNWNTFNVTDMGEMFWYCSSLTSLYLSGWNTSNVRSMSRMFDNCFNMSSINISGWNTSNVEWMNCMFSNCSSLTGLDLSGWNTSNVTTMAMMFEYCSNLTNLNLSGWNTSSVTDMGSMFANCSSLTSLNLSSWNTSSVTDMGSMFAGCSSLTSLNISSWNTSNVEGMWDMFSNCSSLTNLNLSGWNTSNVGSMDGLFLGCTNMINLNIANFDLSLVYSINNMCSGLAESSRACTITCTSMTRNRLESFISGLDTELITWNIVGKK